MEANSSCLILRTFACVGYKESEEHIFKTKTDREPFSLQNHRSLKDILASCRPESSKRLAAGFFVQCLLHNVLSEVLQIGFLHCLNFPVYWGRKPHRLMLLSLILPSDYSGIIWTLLSNFWVVFYKCVCQIDCLTTSPTLPVLCLGSRI